MSPNALATPCAAPGCPELTYARYCEEHSKQRGQYDRDRGSAAVRGYDRRWRRIRRMFLNRHPLCANPFNTHPSSIPATEVHHVVALQDGGSHSFDNLEALCKPCHSNITHQEMKETG